MKQTYYVNTGGDHEVHIATCSQVPGIDNRLYLGVFETCQDAVREAKNKYTKTNGCYYCCRPCHTG